MPRLVSAVLRFAVSALVIGLTGCFTLVGVGIGHGLDLQAPDTVNYTANELLSVGRNLPGRIRTNTGSERIAMIVRTELENGPSYYARVAVVCSLASSSIPVPPETVNAVIGQTLYRGCVLHGYEASGIWFAPSPDRQPFYLAWDRVSVLRSSSGQIWTGEELRNACSTAHVPSRLGLLVRPTDSRLRALVEKGSAQTEFIPAADIRTVTVPNRTHNVVWGLIGGLAVDVALSSMLLRDANFMNFDFDFNGSSH